MCSSGVLHQMFMVLFGRWRDNEAFGQVTKYYESWLMHCGVLQTAACSLLGSRVLNPTEGWKPDPSAGWGNWSPGALILFPMYVRSGRSTSASQVYWFAHLKSSNPWRARHFPFIISLCNTRFSYWMYFWQWRLIASWAVIVTVQPAAWGVWVFLSTVPWETTSEHWVWFGAPQNQAGNNRQTPK